MIFTGQPIISVTFFKFVGGLALLIIELFVCCYGFNLVESAVKNMHYQYDINYNILKFNQGIEFS